MSERRRIASGGEWERAYGYCRALRVGDRIIVSGCTSSRDGVVLHPADPAAQLRVALDTALAAVVELGGSVADVIRTRMYVTHRRDCDAVGRVHAQVFAATPPAATMVIVAGLLHQDMRVEIEVEALVGGGHDDTDPGS
ncbi:RidA family protein [Lapillicoccus sp.]|uniref:RidA family protein n=1 Tax=Lapillicoccus sp. TaxID=1909287 RepID=UPI0039832073